MRAMTLPWFAGMARRFLMGLQHMVTVAGAVSSGSGVLIWAGTGLGAILCQIPPRDGRGMPRPYGLEM